MYEVKTLSRLIEKLKIAEKLSYSMNKGVAIDSSKIECLKSTRRSSIYKLFVQSGVDYDPIVLKIYNSTDYKNEIEINIYDRAYPILKEFLPEIYHIEKNGNETWVFMEFVRQIRGQINFLPKYFDYIIPTVANLHARTFEGNGRKLKDDWKSWLPIYESSRMRNERTKQVEKTIGFLDDGMKDDRLRGMIQPQYTSLVKLFNKGPDFFPELLENGSSITHGDLHLQNICSNNVTLHAPWNIQFIDWESTKYAPVWFDMVVLVEILMGFRRDWQGRAEEIRTHCVEVYAKEMQKNGINFKMRPMDLYKMAYLQRTLEKGLHTQLRRIFDNRGGELLPYHLEKISTWGRAFGL